MGIGFTAYKVIYRDRFNFVGNCMISCTESIFLYVSSSIIREVCETICMHCENVGADTDHFMSSLCYTPTASRWCSWFRRHSISRPKVGHACAQMHLVSTPWTCCINFAKCNSILFFLYTDTTNATMARGMLAEPSPMLLETVVKCWRKEHSRKKL